MKKLFFIPILFLSCNIYHLQLNTCKCEKAKEFEIEWDDCESINSFRYQFYQADSIFNINYINISN